MYGVFRPGVFFASLGWLIGLAVLASGIDGFGSWWAEKKLGYASVWNLVMAILSTLFGILLLTNIGLRLLTDELMLTLFGVWIAVSGVIRIVTAVQDKPKLWGLMVAVGVLLIVLAVVSLLHPLITALSIGLCVAMNFVFQGVNMIVGAFAIGDEPDEEV